MIPAAQPENEPERLADLRALRMLDTPPEERFDRLTRLAAKLFDAPISLLSLLDEERQWFKSKHGVSAAEGSRKHSFCSHAILRDGHFVVADARLDARFADNPIVTGEPGVVFYAGYPVTGPGGLPVGALCVVDRKPRRAAPRELDALRDLAMLASEELRASVQKEVAARALESELQLQDILDNTLDLVLCVSPEGRLLYANFAWRDAMGYGERQVPFLELEKLLHPDSRARWDDAFRRARSGETVRELELSLVSKAGLRVVVYGSLAGKPGQIQGIFDNITLRRQKEEELRASEEQLRQSQKMEAVGSLAGGIAHDFNNILTVILGYSAVVHASLDPKDKKRSDIEEVLKASHRAAALTRQLLAFSRRQVITPRLLNLNAVVSSVSKMLRRLIGDSVELVTQYDPRLGSVRADQGQLEQVILNLSVNARDAMGRGGKLTLETAEAVLDDTSRSSRVLGAPAGRYVMLAATDTGCGMPPEVRARIFEPFFTTKEPGKGTGMGLSTVYGIVKQAGGDIWVHSEPGAGTAFKVYLPLAEGEAEPLAGTEAPDGDAVGDETILIVEDEEPVRALLWQVLQPCGYSLLEASGPREALKVCQRVQHPIHLLVTDVMMHGQIGRELAENLAPLYPEMRVLYVSGYTDDTVIQHGILEEGLHYLQKPFTPEQLRRKVREVLDAPPAETPAP